MVIEEGYCQGLDTFLTGRLDRKDLNDMTRGILHYAAYSLPFYGLYDQHKKPKKERNKVGVIFSNAVIISFIAKYILFPSYLLVKGAATGDWHPFRFDSKDKVELKVEDKTQKSNDLERTLNLHDISQ